ncbi:prolyl oligopeptidase family serine peptidase [Urbifossiella limnaea]|uniref:Prolyl oligopeptidase family protein n=1 Tax=Urbifossiella limnaea TaxID=2528023 RepID=A0A517XTE0_9BACT|nr:prolyl oligopeptidase family serine peptidase [Urbifossiella limnaea]QDU20761.1 Prolyl oligopeptidase family protein [Urbifossiella limnaea]
MFARAFPAALLAALVALPAAADGPADNIPDNVRPVPPKGIDLPPADDAELRKGLAELQGLIKDIGRHPLLADVAIYEKAVRYAVEYKEVFDPKGIPAVKNVLKAGLERARLLKDGKHPWTTQTGYVVRGYFSKIDGSAQPYGLHVPANYQFVGNADHRLDFWWHGRGETLSEVNFLAVTQNAGGIIPAPGAFILAPYGRYCNANKFAGEIDTFECLAHVSNHYRIDWSRLVARGFSMGGAACWQYAVHFPTLWCAAAPGAGFSETPEFLNNFQGEKVQPKWYEQKLWRMYNATDYAQNIFNVPTVAYSGEIDKQKQAADVMAREMKKVGLELTHVVGPKTAHSYEKAAKEEVNKRIDAVVAKGLPKQRDEIRFTTYTLSYNQCDPILLDGLVKHWEPATVRATMKDGAYDITTTGVTAFTLRSRARDVKVTVNGKVVLDQKGLPDVGRPNEFRFTDVAGGPAVGAAPASGLAKTPGLQGPIDDAFLSRFVMVRPTGKALNEKVGAWADAEMKHAVTHWRKHFRGDAPVTDDTKLTDEQIKNANLVLWGDPNSNAVLAKIADKLPVKWTAAGVTVGDKTYPAGTHVPVLIYPNPLNPTKYVVLNSGFTFREYAYLNNARQVPMLPDYAVVDITTPPNSRYPGNVVRAGFFGEKWELLANDGR